MQLLLTTTSYQDTPGEHHDLLASGGFDEIIRARGPLSESELLTLIDRHGGFDALLNGDDALTARVIDAASPRLKVISKYGIGLDSIDVEHATQKRIPVLFTPGVNHTTVAEHVIGLMIALSKHFWPLTRDVKQGQWHRITGRDLAGKTLGVVGMGRIGREVITRGRAFGMACVGLEPRWDASFAAEHAVGQAADLDDLLGRCDIVSLHMPLTPDTRGIIDRSRIERMKDGAMLINTARGPLIDEGAVADACRRGKLAGYAADVLAHEPIQPPHPFQELDNVIITPHIGSRTYESVQRQAMRATRNVIHYLAGERDYIQANPFE